MRSCSDAVVKRALLHRSRDDAHCLRAYIILQKLCALSVHAMCSGDRPCARGAVDDCNRRAVLTNRVGRALSYPSPRPGRQGAGGRVMTPPVWVVGGRR